MAAPPFRVGCEKEPAVPKGGLRDCVRWDDREHRRATRVTHEAQWDSGVPPASGESVEPEGAQSHLYKNPTGW